MERLRKTRIFILCRFGTSMVLELQSDQILITHFSLAMSPDVLLFCIISDSAKIEELAIGLKESLHTPFLIQGQHVVISASIGINLYPDHGTTAEQLLQQSDTAMLDVKESGENNYQWYSQAIETPRTRRSLIERLLKSALEQGELQLVYQPK